MGKRYTHFPPAPTSCAGDSSSATAPRGPAIDMIIKRGITYSLPIRMSRAHQLPVNVFGDGFVVARDKLSTGSYAMKNFDHTPGGVTCIGVSVPLAYYGANSDAAEDKGRTFEACFGHAMEESRRTQSSTRWHPVVRCCSTTTNLVEPAGKASYTRARAPQTQD